MTITTNDTRDEYTATAGQTVFNYTFKIFEDTDLLVYQTADGATPDDTTDLITAYTVTGAGNSAGGTIILDTGATLNDLITIVSNVAEERTTDYQFNADFAADVVNEDLDRVVTLVKQLGNKIDRTPLFDNAVQSASGLKWAAPTALEFIRWNAAADELESVSLNTTVGADNAAAISFSTTTSGLTGTDVQAAIDEIDATIDKLNTLSGVAKDAVNLGTFTGSTIADNSTNKTALQALETALELIVVSSGTWTPTVTNVSNVAASVARSCIYSRVGNTVNFSGRVDVDPTLANTSTVVSLTLPVSSNFGAVTDAAGTIVALEDTTPTYSAQTFSGVVIAKVSDDLLYLACYPDSASNRLWFFSGSYRVI